MTRELAISAAIAVALTLAVGTCTIQAQVAPDAAGMPQYEYVAPTDHQSPALYEERWTSTNDPTLEANQHRVRTYARPIWYPDPSTGELNRIQVDLQPVVDAVDGATAYQETRNLVGYRVNAKGVSTFARMGYILRTRLLQVRIENEATTTARTTQVAQEPTALVRDSARVVRATGLRNYLTHETRVLNGSIKENLILSNVPDNALTNAEAVLFVFQWSTPAGAPALTLAKEDTGDLVWSAADGSPIFRAKAPYVYDAAFNGIASRYLIRGQYYAVGVRAAALRNATYPVTIDPTYTTVATDALYSSSTKNGTGLIYEGNYQAFRLPGLHGVTSIDAAVAGFYCSAADADMTFDVYCDVVGAWNESSTYSTLEALAFNAATATGQLADNVNTYEEYDILGSAATNGIAKAYNGTDTPNDITVKLYRDGSVTQASKENFFLLGTYDTNWVGFHDNDDANDPYIEITYTGYDLAVNDNVADLGFHVLYNRSVGEASYNDSGYTAYTSAFSLLANPPDLTEKTIQEAWLEVYCSSTYGGGFATTYVRVADTDAAPWNESSTYSTLNGLSMGSASANTLNLGSTGYKWVDVTSLVQGIYAADSTPETITVKLTQTEDTYTDNQADTVFELGDSAEWDLEDHAVLSTHGLATYMRLYIWYSAAPPAGTTTYYPSGSAGVLMIKNDENTTRRTPYETAPSIPYDVRGGRLLAAGGLDIGRYASAIAAHASAGAYYPRWCVCASAPYTGRAPARRN